MMSADVIWCDRCGAYATDKSKGLTQQCPGVPSDWAGGGRPQQLVALRAGRHPKTGEWLGHPCPEPRWDALAHDASGAVALPMVAVGYLERRRPCHDRGARPVPAPPVPAPASASPAAQSGFSVHCTASGAERRNAMYARVRARAAPAIVAAAAGEPLAAALCAAVTAAPGRAVVDASHGRAGDGEGGYHRGARADLGLAVGREPGMAPPARGRVGGRRRCRTKCRPPGWQ